MSNLVLDALMLLVFGTFLLSRFAASGPSGPEGPVGGWLVAVPPVFLITIVLVSTINLGRFDWVFGGRPLCFFLIVGVLVAMAAAMFVAFDRVTTFWHQLAGLVPFLILAACVWAVHGFEDVIPRTTGRAGAGAILGLSAAFGWGLMAFGFAMHVKGKIAAAEAAAAKEQAWQEERAAQDLAKFRALPADAPLPELLEFIHSWNAAIQKEARERIAARPNLEDELIAGLSSDWSEAAVGYIAFIDDKPSARYAPALALVLDHQVEVWRSTFEYDEYASKWEPNISRFVEAATKVQAAGGNLKPQIQAWYDLIRKAKGMEGMAMYLRAALERS